MDNSKPCFVFRIKSSDTETAAGELEEKIEEVKTMASQIPPVAMILGGIDFFYGTDESWVKVGV